ncbi:MAG: PIN domain-containing protein [Terriglobales bacterium]
MIFTPGNDYSAVLDACVLVPMALCDLLLRLAEEPAMYRPVWSEQILAEMGRALKIKLHRSSEEVAWRRQQMKEAFPEAMVTVPSALLKAVECIPDKNDRHVLAAAIMARADAIVTQNTRHFPKDCCEKYGVLCQTPSDFLIDRYRLHPQQVLDKLDDQAAGISQNREFVVASLKGSVPKFCKLVAIQAI